MSQVNPMAFMQFANMGLDLHNMQHQTAQRAFSNQMAERQYALDQQRAAMAQQEWDLQRPVLEDRNANLGMDRSMKNADWGAESVANGASPEDILGVQGKTMPQYFMQNPNQNMKPEDIRMMNYLQGIKQRVAMGDAMKQKDFDYKQGYIQNDQRRMDIDEQRLNFQREQFANKTSGQAGGINAELRRTIGFLMKPEIWANLSDQEKDNVTKQLQASIPGQIQSNQPAPQQTNTPPDDGTRGGMSWWDTAKAVGSNMFFGPEASIGAHLNGR
jgi:hypothetical protein